MIEMFFIFAILLMGIAIVLNIKKIEESQEICAFFSLVSMGIAIASTALQQTLTSIQIKWLFICLLIWVILGTISFLLSLEHLDREEESEL